MIELKFNAAINKYHQSQDTKAFSNELEGNAFILYWQNGSVEKIIDRLICEFDDSIDFDSFGATKA